MSADCQKFSDATDFFLWAATINKSLGFTDETLAECRSTICAALLGSGNPDISGIGVVAAYCVEIGGGLFLAIALWGLQRLGNRESWLYHQIEGPVMQGMSSFFDSAVFFCLAIQIASIVVLAKRDYLVSTIGFGQYEAQMTLDISIACIIPLMYPISMLRLWNRTPRTSVRPSKDVAQADDCKLRRRRESHIVALYCFVMALFVYPLLSQLVNNWKPSEIGVGKAPDNKPDLAMKDFDVLFGFCSRGAKPLSARENKILAGFEVAASAIIIFFTIWTVANAAISTTPRGAEPPNFIVAGILRVNGSVRKVLGRLQLSWVNPVVFEIFLLTLPMTLVGGLLWGIFRIREAQKALAEATGNSYKDNEWTFGQVIAIVMFMPVLSDMVYSWWYQDLK